MMGLHHLPVARQILRPHIVGPFFSSLCLGFPLFANVNMHNSSTSSSPSSSARAAPLQQAAAYGEELAWLPKGPVPHQEVVYREGPRTPHGHENTATPPAVA